MEMQQSNRVSTIMMVRGGQCQRVGPSPVMRLTQVIKHPSSPTPPPSPSSVTSDHGTLIPSSVISDHGQLSPLHSDLSQFSPYSDQGQFSPSVHSDHGQLSPSVYSNHSQVIPSPAYSNHGQMSPSSIYKDDGQVSPSPVVFSVQVINQPSLSPPPLIQVSPGHNLINT